MATETHGEAEAGLVFHPMDQFQVTPLFGGGTGRMVYNHQCDPLDGSHSPGPLLRFWYLGARGRALVPTRSQSIAELAYGLVYTRWLKM